MSSVSGITATVAPSVVSNAEQNPEVGIPVLKKALDTAKEMINILLPTPPPVSSGLDISA